MDSNTHTRLVTTLLEIQGMDDYTVRTSLILNIQGHQRLARHNQDARADVTFIVNGLAEMRFSDGTWALLTFIDNALARVWPGTSLRTQLQELRHLLEAEQTNPLPSSPPVSTDAPFRQAQLTTMENANDKENNPAVIKADIILVTVAEVEAKAILSFFPNPKLSHIGDQTYHDFGMIGGARTFMVQSEMGSGGQSGAILTIQEGITALHPTAVIMVGIAFGVNEQKQHIGDILVSKQLMDYDLQRIGTDTDSKSVIIPRGDRPSASPRMLSRFRAAKKYWEVPPEVKFGLVLSGAKLVDNQDFRDQLLKFEPEAIGGEMEGGGLYAAAQRKKVDWILVKAICDWGDGHKKQDESQRQKEADENAAHFTKFVIEKGGFGSSILQETQPDVAHNQPSFLQRKIETQDFDVFLSYNSGDRAAVKKIGEDLKKHGILPWLDEWELRPGLPWQPALEQQIRTIKSAAVFVGKTGMGPWHLSEMDALLRQFKKRNCPVIPVLLPDAPQEPDLPIFLEEMSWVDFRKQEPDPLEELIWGITGQPPLPSVDVTQEFQPTANTIVNPVHFWQPAVDNFYTMTHGYFDDIVAMHVRVVEICNPFIKGQLIWPDQHQRTIKSIVELGESVDKFSDLLATIDQTSLSGADISPQQLLKLTIGFFAIKRHIRDLETHAAVFPNNGRTLSKPLMRQQMLRALELLQQSMKEVQSVYTSMAPTKTPNGLQVDTPQSNQSMMPEPEDLDARGQIVPIQRQPIKLSDPDKDALASSLLKCPCISDSNRREAVVRRLPENIRNSRIKDSRQDIDVQNIVEACANYPGGIESLIAAVRFYDADTWQMQEVDAVLSRIN